MAAEFSASALWSPVQRLANQTILFQRGEYIFATFGLFAGVAAVAGGAVAGWLLLSRGSSVWETSAVLAIILVGHVAPARLFLLPWRVRMLRDDPRTVARTVEFASWGGIAAIAVVLGVYTLATDISMLGLTDIAVRAGVLAHAIGRIGCISLGCCYGRPTGLPFAVCYENPMAKAVRHGDLKGVPIHPAPLYEAGFLLTLFVFLNAIALAGAPEGMPTAFYLVLYGVGRFGLESLRHNTAADRMGPLLRNQWLCLAMIVPGLALLPRTGLDPTFSAPGLGEFMILTPVLAVSGVMVFLAYSMHRGRLGHW
jgi:phosphatidylglycerol:prolipoprotein diacylglycerol transferase